MMRAQGIADAVVPAFHGHDETVMRRTYTLVTMDELRAAADQNVTSRAGK